MLHLGKYKVVEFVHVWLIEYYGLAGHISKQTLTHLSGCSWKKNQVSIAGPI